MSTYTTKEEWQNLYEDPELKKLRLQAIDKLNVSGNQVHPGTMNAVEEIWNLCVAVSERIKGGHTRIGTGRRYDLGQEGHKYIKVKDASVLERSITLEAGDKEIIFDLIKFKDTLDCFNEEKYELCNVRAKNGWKRDNEKLEKVLPMISLGIFQVSGRNWINAEEMGNNEKNFEHFVAGRPGKYDIGNGVSLTGHFENKEMIAEIVNLGREMNNQISEIIDLLELRKNVILEGVPGTGKTWLRDVIREKMNATLESTSFHPAKTYEEFVGGIFPQNEDDELHFNYLEGTVTKIANKAMKDTSGGKYILFIDELNRANIPMVMGELLTIIESTKRTSPDGDNALKDKPTDSTWEVAVHTDPNHTKYLRLPSNLYILATMNTSDRSVISMDAALRRRFAYYRLHTKLVDSCMMEMKNILQKTDVNNFWSKRNLMTENGLFETMFSVLADINQNILKKEIGPDAMLGHSYLFVSEDEVESLPRNEEVISEIMQLSILPQIADTLTNMNRTDSAIVNQINTMLKPLSSIGACEYLLKEPTDNKNSLDVAVTVVRNSNDLNSYNPEDLFNKDDSIFKTANNGACAYIRHVKEAEVCVLIRSTLIVEQKRKGNRKIVQELLHNGTLTPQGDGKLAVFVKEYQNTQNTIGRMVTGRQTFDGPKLWKNYQGKTLREYYPNVKDFQEK